MIVLLNGKGFEAALPDMAAGLILPMIPPYMRGE
jgi:hypothetical protein